jgi:hypothetical protein
MAGANPLRNSTDKELGAQIGKAMGQLSEDHRAIVLLREVEGMSYEEIATTIGVPKGTVMSRLFHARKNLQRLLRPALGIAEGMGPSGRPLEEGRPQKSDGTDPESTASGEEPAPAGRRTSMAPSVGAPGGE